MAAAVGMRMALLFLVVGLVKSCAFKNYTAAASYKTVDPAAALWALLYRLVLHALEQVEILLTLIA